MRYIDCNFWIGRRSTPTVYDVHDTAASTALLKDLGVCAAFATHTASREYDPVVGNALGSQAIKAFGDFPLYPVWVVLPGTTKDFPSGEALRSQLKENGVRLVRMYPAAGNHNFCLSDWCCKALFEDLEAVGVPVLLDAGQMSWDELETLVRQHPGLNVILSNLTYRYDRYVYPLLERYSNLYLETAGLRGFLQVEDLCARFGAERLVFGTNAPVYDAGASFAIVQMADISDEDRAKIAAGNLCRLTGICP